jgi:hypothetical protein
MKVLSTALVVSSLFGSPANSQFVGELYLVPAGCQQTGSCTVRDHFGFSDSRGVGWEAAAGNVTDGASIPRWAQIFVGVPFRNEYIPAAVLHDHYSASERPVRRWRQTQRMFYEALRAAGVPEPRASVLYSAVLVGSKRWIEQLVGRPCAATENCINVSGQIVISTIISEAESYGTQAYETSFARVREQIEV